MAIAFIETPEALTLPEHQQVDTAQLRALPGSSETRSFLLDDVVHVVDLWTYPRNGMEDMTRVEAVKSFELNSGIEHPLWTVRGSSRFIDHKTRGTYTQADIQPVGAMGRTAISWLRIPTADDEMALFAAPLSLPRRMNRVELDPEFAARIHNPARYTGHLTVVN